MSSSSTHLPSSDLMEALLKDPMKRALILQLLNQEKPNLPKHKQELKTRTTPLKKAKKLHCESPTALQRRRALLERQNQDSASESSSSEFSEPPTQVDGPELPFEELLKGVRAYVEVKRDNVDRSEGIKAVMKLMGATIKETFTNDVTHVIFKDGSFTTYEKAKLMKVHLVSVLWLDAIRRHNARVPEKNYPAFGHRVCDANVSILCSQIQKDYEDVIKDEKRTRRHTMMTPKTSISSYLTAHNVDEPTRSPELTSDDSDCGVVDGYTSKKSNNDLLRDSPALTDDVSVSSKKANSSGDSASLLSRARRKTINVTSNMILTPNIDAKKSESVIEATPPQGRKSKKVLKESTAQMTLGVSTDTDKTASGLFDSKQSGAGDKENSNRRSSSSSSRRRNSGGTTMSSLRLSESPGKRSSGTVSSAGEEVADINKKVRRKTSSRSSTNVEENRISINSDFNDTNSTKNRSSNNNSKLINSLLEALESDSDESSKGRNPSGRKVRRNILESSTEVENPKTPKKIRKSPDESENEKTKRGRRMTVMPETNLRRSRRASSVAVQKVQSDDENSTDTKRSLSEDRKSPDVRRKRNLKKPPSGDGSEASAEARRKTDSFSVVLTRIEINKENTTKTPGRTRKTADPSPPKKTRVEETSSNKKTRKLYNPDDISAIASVEEEKEREEYVKQKTQKSPDGVFLNPNNIHITPMPSSRRKDNSEQSSLSSDESDFESTKTKEKKAQTPVRRDSTKDEQKELLAFLEKTEQARERRSQRLTLSQTKPKYHSSSSDSLSNSSLPITPIKRRSTLDFVSLTQSQQKRKLKLDPRRVSSIVCTKMHRHEVVNFESVVNKLGRFFVEDQVTGKTTHLIAGESKRTINMLRAIARGCWILKHDWLLKSAEAGKWLNEEDYELTDFSPAVQQCRLQRAAFGPLFSMDIFKDCGYIYVAKTTTPKTSDLKELISICRGRVTNVYRNASISVGEYFDREEITCVNEAWILDSIHFNRMKSLKNYLMKPQGQDSPHF